MSVLKFEAIFMAFKHILRSRQLEPKHICYGRFGYLCFSCRTATPFILVVEIYIVLAVFTLNILSDLSK